MWKIPTFLNGRTNSHSRFTLQLTMPAKGTGRVDLQKSRMRAVAEAVVALAAQPEGFSAADLR